MIGCVPTKIQQKESIVIEVDGIEYSLNEEEKTASITNNRSATGNLFIPRFIKCEEQEYLITNISENAFKNSKEIISIQFSPDSELRIINENAFFDSTIKSISIPSSLIELKKGWCSRTPLLTKIHIESNNQRYSIHNNEFIIGKSMNENENYDVLVFSVRDIKKVEIPSFIEIIGPHAFDYCKQLEHVTFSKESKLRIIEEGAFSFSSIRAISIPPHVTRICADAFLINGLEKIDFPENSELMIIEKNAFDGSVIESISIPSSVVDLGECCFGLAQNLNSIKFMPNNQRYKIYEDKFLIGKSSTDDDNYDQLILSVRNIETATIPDFIKVIGQFAFSFCKKIKTIKFSENSELQTISENAFYCSSIEKIIIPPHVTEIKESAFNGCMQLKQVEIPKNSELKTIENDSFMNTLIENLLIPSNLVDLKDGWCHYVPNLNKITVMPDNKRYAMYDDKFLIGKSSPEKEDFDVLICSVHDIQDAIIPDFIEIIGPYSFGNCDQLQNVITTENSKLKIIEYHAFEESSIQSISIPPQLIKIDQNAFSLCHQLRRVEIPKNSMLKEIGEYAFYDCDLDAFSLTPFITRIQKGTFFSCNQLLNIEIPTNSNLQAIEKDAFYDSSIESLTIPSNLVELEKSWCVSISNLKSFEIMSDNKRFTLYENKFIIGKSSLDVENYDTLVLAVRNIEVAIIPSFIKVIGPYAFDSCKNLQKIVFSNEENLQVIDAGAFSNSSIKNISIPFYVTHLKDRAFFMDFNICSVDIPINSKIRMIEHETFAHSTIKSISIPPKINKISRTAFLWCNELQIIEINDNSELRYLDASMFFSYGQIIILIPYQLRNIIH